MHTVGIIAEYNPFHTGHAYHIQKAKELSGADYAVVVMSPDFVQRGEPAVFDKYMRAHMALLNGADLVVELPVCYATGSAEYFAEGGVTLLDRLGAVDTLCFGAEQADPALFETIAALLCEEPPAYTKELRDLLRQGKTFPQARSEAVVRCLCASGDSDCVLSSHNGSGHKAWDPQELTAFLNAPNNILGIEYYKALHTQKSRIRPLPVPRNGSDFNSVSLSGDYCSASAIRSGLSGENKREVLQRYVPENCHTLFTEARQFSMTAEELLPFLVQKLLSMDSFDSISDISSDLSDRIRSLRYACIGKNWEQIVALLKTRQLTDARIRRALLHLILDIRSEDVRDFRASGTVFYAEVLGLRREASPLLRAVREFCPLPFLTKPSHATKFTDPLAQRMWKQDLFASHLYRSISVSHTGRTFRTEYEISPLVL